MPNPGPSTGGLPNSEPASIVVGSNVTYTFATLPPATNFLPGFIAMTSDEGLCVVTSTYTWEVVSSGGVALSAGTNILTAGTASFANSNGVSFGMNTAGVITATVTPGAAAGIGAIQLPNTTYTSGTVNFLNSNGLSFGSTTGGGVTASYNSTQFAGLGTTFAGTNVSASLTLNSAGLNVALSVPTETGVGISAAGSSQTSGNVVFSNSNGLSFGMNGSTVTGSYNSTQFAGTGTTFAGANVSGSITLNSAGINLSLSGPVESGIGLSAAGSSQTAGNIVFSNSNGVSFGMNGSTVTASVAAGGGGGIDVTLGGNTSGALALVSTGTLFLAGGNNVTLSQNGNSVTISGANAGGAQTGISGLQVSNTTYSSGTVSLVNANGISFGSSGANGISASYTVPTQSVQTEGRYAIGNTTGQSSSSTFDARTMSFSGAGGVSLGYSGNALVISGAAGSSQTEGIFLAGNTTGQSSQSTYTVGSLNLSAAGVISLGWSSNSLIISAPGTTGITQLSAGFSTGGNTAGTTGLASAQLVLAGGANITLSGSTNAGSMTLSIVGGAGAGGIDVSLGGNTTGTLALVSTGTLFLAGGNNVTLSQNGNSVTISGANAGGAQTGISGIQVSNTTYSSGTITFQNANGISFGSSGANGISASYTVPAQVSTIGLYGLGNTTQNSSTTLNQSALSFNGLGEITVGYSNGSIQLSVPPSSIGVSTGGNTLGNTGTYSGQLILAGGNNITLSVSSGAGGAQTITISGANAGGAQTGISGLVVSNTTYTSGTVTFQNANGISFGSSGANGISASYTVPTQSNQTIGLYALGNTTNNSSTTLDARTLSFDALGAMTLGYSNGSIQVSAPATSSLSATGLASISVNGSTISIGVAGTTESVWKPPYWGSQTAVQIGNGTIQIFPAIVDGNFSASRADLFISLSGSTLGLSSYAGTISAYAALYTRTGSTLSLASSGSQSYSFSLQSAITNQASFSGYRNISIPINVNAAPQDCWIGVMSQTASANTNAWTASNMLFAGANAPLAGLLGAASNATQQPILGLGVFSASSAALPSSIAFSQINGTGSNAVLVPAVVFHNVTA